MSQQFLVPLDAETGGLDHETSDILTLYLSVFDEDLKFVAELDLKLKPDNRLPIAEAGALRVNGIDIQKHLADPNTITYSQAKEKIIEFLKKHLQKTGRFSNLTPLGHNVTFDLGYIWKYLVPKEEWNKIVHYGILDTKQIADFLKRAGWFPPNIGTLESLVEQLGVPKRPAHNAKEDTLMCVDAFRALLAMMKSKRENSSASQDLISLLEQE